MWLKLLIVLTIVMILYNKLKDVGASDRVICWFRTYLAHTQLIKYGDTFSYKKNIPAGIAQGTVLGPLIFILYINNCITVLDKVKISMFADDCILYRTGNNWNRIHEVFQSQLTHFVDWSKRNRLMLNERKTQSMIMGNRSKLLKSVDLFPLLSMVRQ